MRSIRCATVALFLIGVMLAAHVRAETGYDGWLRYARLSDENVQQYKALPDRIVRLDDSTLITSAQDELVRGLKGLLNRDARVGASLDEGNAIVLATRQAIVAKAKQWNSSAIEQLSDESFCLKTVAADKTKSLLIIGGGERGLLYGVFSLLRKIAVQQRVDSLDECESPAAPIRILNHWDNLDGTIERGYAGKSIFWENGHVAKDMSRVRDYARLMASVGINGCSINNVNADARVVTAEYLPEVARIAEAFRPWGVRMYISLNFAGPREVGGVQTFDPLDPKAVEFWKQTVDKVYRAIPDLGGFVLKADSEGRLGPSEYGRTHADAANVIARALKPHGGILFYRGFVYDHLMDWRNLKNDRAKAAYENFHKLDGQFEDNVVIQIKHGPIDFQVREPASPLFGGLEKTNEAVELQITQEYLGQQRHVCFTVPMWKETLDFDMQAGKSGTPVKQIVAGKTFRRPTGGFVGVSNVGRDENWLGHHLAMANLYGFGRLAWNPNLSSEQIADEWTRQTFGNDPIVVKTIVDILLRSWPIYESYTGPLGIGTLTDIIHIHFGPAPASSEFNGWGQWHRANETGVGMDRTVVTGTGFVGQYRPPVAAQFESLETCPDDLLLFMHHVPYTHKLHSGKTVIQHFYDTHYQGADDAAALVDQWRSLDGRVDEQRYREVLDRLEFQAGHAQVWRDSICRWFMKRSGIADEKGRVGNYPNRAEAEDQKLDGYQLTKIEPWEAASGQGAVQLPENVSHGAIRFAFKGQPGVYDLRVQYFDEEDGASKFKLFVDDKLVDEWQADGHLPTPTNVPDAHSSTRRTAPNVALHAGDEIRLEGSADGGERAAVDYFEIVPNRAAVPSTSQ
ncbi:MAG TPA: alpha-glucuronidase family glycosyl hydrolase [Lacipirellulaceae bacterium]|nr:alpha-glucuronidase family glycosyl hydrolase [Lacipirellulaceae bacterium]